MRRKGDCNDSNGQPLFFFFNSLIFKIMKKSAKISVEYKQGDGGYWWFYATVNYADGRVKEARFSDGENAHDWILRFIDESTELHTLRHKSITIDIMKEYRE